MNTRVALSLMMGLAVMAVLAAACFGGLQVDAASPAGLAEPLDTPTLNATAPVQPTTSAPPTPLTTSTTPSTTSLPETPGGVVEVAVTRTPPPRPSTTTTVAPGHESYVVDPNEVAADAKQLAGTIALALTTYRAGTSPATVAASITDAPQARSELATAARPLVHDDRWSRGEILYPQLGGLTKTAASVMVVVRQMTGTADTTPSTHTRTLDIRLEMLDGAWTFVGLASAGGTPVARPVDLSREAIAVLDDPRIQLPDSARWDIYRGHTSNALLQVMIELAGKTPYAVTVLGTGHPHDVFGTDRTSNHTVGRAVDVYMLGNDLVLDDRIDGSFTYTTLQWLYDRPDVYKVGGPWALDGPGGRSFTNLVHQDHLHISVLADQPSA